MIFIYPYDVSYLFLPLSRLQVACITGFGQSEVKDNDKPLIKSEHPVQVLYYNTHLTLTLVEVKT